MKKIIFIAVALVVALGGLGIGYAAWTDEVTVTGTVSTAEVCVKVKAGTVGEVNNCFGTPVYTYPGATPGPGDTNWVSFIPGSSELSCPPGYVFDDVRCTDKNVAWVTWAFVTDSENQIKAITFYIHNAYPYYYTDLSLYLCNCGTLPVNLVIPVIQQDPSIIIEYGDNIGKQLEPGDCSNELSFKVGVTQHQNRQLSNGSWIINDPTMPLTEQGATLTFTVDMSVIQWNEYPD